MGLFDVGGKFKPRNVAGVASARFIEPHGCEEIDEFRVKYANAEKLRNISANLASAAEYGAATAHRLQAIAHAPVALM